jgi:hypothetical protein
MKNFNLVKLKLGRCKKRKKAEDSVKEILINWTLSQGCKIQDAKTLAIEALD